MNKKGKFLLVLTFMLAMVGTGAIGKSVADSFWVGHENMVQTSANIDKLTAKLQSLKDSANAANNDLVNLTNANKQLQSQYNDLATQKNNEEASLQQQIQEKIQEGNNKVAEKQKEVDGLNQKITELNNTISQQSSQNSADMRQAVSDAQSLRDKSDQAVNNYTK